MQSGICLSPLHRDFCSHSTFSSSLLGPHRCPAKAAWLLPLGSTNTGAAPALSTEFPAGTGTGPSALGSATAVAQSRQQCSSSSCTSQTAQIVQLGLLQDCDRESLCWTSALLMDYQDSQGIQSSFEDGEFTFHPHGLLAFVSHLTVPLSLPIFPWLLSLPGGRSRL